MIPVRQIMAVLVVMTLAGPQTFIGQGFITPRPEAEVNAETISAPPVVIVDQEIRFQGEGSSWFNYRSYGTLTLVIENNGVKPVYYTLFQPDGHPLETESEGEMHELSGVKIAGESKAVLELPLFENQGKQSWGEYHLYVYNDEGSEGALNIAVSTRE